MKNIVKYFVLFLFFFVLSCKKDDMPVYEAGTMEHGSLSACRNGDDWLASGNAQKLSQTDSLFSLYGATFVYYLQDTLQAESFVIKYLPFKEGKYELNGLDPNDVQTPYTKMSFGSEDTVLDSYFLDTGKKSWVKLTKVDTINRRIEGCFEIYLAVEEPKHIPYNPDKLCFKQGEFAVDIIQ